MDMKFYHVHLYVTCKQVKIGFKNPVLYDTESYISPSALPNQAEKTEFWGKWFGKCARTEDKNCQMT